MRNGLSWARSPWGSGSHFPRQPQSSRDTKTALCGLAPLAQHQTHLLLRHTARRCSRTRPAAAHRSLCADFILCGNRNDSEGRAEQEEHHASWTIEDGIRTDSPEIAEATLCTTSNSNGHMRPWIVLHLHHHLHDTGRPLETSIFGAMLFSFKVFKFNLIWFWLCWVFVAARGLSLVAANRGFSCCGAQAPECMGFSSCGSQALEHRLRSCGVQT